MAGKRKDRRDGAIVLGVMCVLGTNTFTSLHYETERLAKTTLERNESYISSMNYKGVSKDLEISQAILYNTARHQSGASVLSQYSSRKEDAQKMIYQASNRLKEIGEEDAKPLSSRLEMIASQVSENSAEFRRIAGYIPEQREIGKVKQSVDALAVEKYNQIPSEIHEKFTASKSMRTFAAILAGIGIIGAFLGYRSGRSD